MLYLGTSDLPIYRFDKIQRTGNLAYLIMEWNERDAVEIPDEAKGLWLEIEDTWYTKTSGNETIMRCALVSEIDYLERRLHVIAALIHSLKEHNKAEIGKELNAWGVKFNSGEPISSQRKELERQLRADNTKIEAKKSELEQMSDTSAPIGILKQKIKLERTLGIKIDIKTTPVDEWLALYDEVLELKQHGERSTHN